MGSGLLLVPIHTDGEEYTLEGTLVSGRPPALENLSSSSQEGLFPSVFGAKTPFLDFSITFQPLLHLNCWYCTEKCLGSSKCCWRTNLDGQGDFFFFSQCYPPKSSCASRAELPDHQQNPSLPGPRMQIYIHPLHGLRWTASGKAGGSNAELMLQG